MYNIKYTGMWIYLNLHLKNNTFKLYLYSNIFYVGTYLIIFWEFKYTYFQKYFECVLNITGKMYRFLTSILNNFVEYLYFYLITRNLIFFFVGL